MSKEWLEFLGGLLVFLGALVPVFRGIWRALRRRLSPRSLFALSLLTISFCTLVYAMVEMYRGRNPGAVAVAFLFAAFIQIIVFWMDDTQVTRRDIALLALMVLAGSLEITIHLQKSNELNKLKDSAPKSEIAPAPSN